MSDALTVISNTAIAAGGVLMRWPRNIAGLIIPDVVIEEQHSDRLQITQHPVAQGSPVSDHAFKLPMTLVMRCGWSNAGSSNAQGQRALALLGGAGETRVREIYQALLALQMPPPPGLVQPFSIVTGKRTYNNMLLAELSVRTDASSEFSLMVEAHFQEVILVNTASTQQAPQSSQDAPDKTSQTQDTPAKNPQPTDNSNIKQFFDPVPPNPSVA